MGAGRLADLLDAVPNADLLTVKRQCRQDFFDAQLGPSSERGGPQLRRPTVTGRWDAACGHGGCYVIEVHCTTDSQATRWLERLLPDP